MDAAKKPVIFLVNDRRTIKPNNTTSLLMLLCLEDGYDVLITDVTNLKATSSNAIFADALCIKAKPSVASTRDVVAYAEHAEEKTVDFMSAKTVIIRTTPGQDLSRSWAHRFALEIKRLLHQRGLRIVNSPIGLQRASSKLYSVCLPSEYVPRTMVCHSLKSVLQFVEELNSPFVIKPLLGSQGRDVFFLEGINSLNTRQVAEILGRTGYLIVQKYLPDASQGDVRVLVLDGKIISKIPAVGIRRRPAAGERRSNISLGGTASIVRLSEKQIDVCTKVAKILLVDDIRFAGLDLIGDKIVEVNVFSPSGLQDLELHYGRRFLIDVADTLIG